MGPLAFRRFGNGGLGRLRLVGRGTRVGRKGGGDRGRGSRECRGRGEVSFTAMKRVARFVRAKSGNIALSATVEAHVLFHASGPVPSIATRLRTERDEARARNDVLYGQVRTLENERTPMMAEGTCLTEPVAALNERIQELQ